MDFGLPGNGMLEIRAGQLQIEKDMGCFRHSMSFFPLCCIFYEALPMGYRYRDLSRVISRR